MAVLLVVTACALFVCAASVLERVLTRAGLIAPLLRLFGIHMGKEELKWQQKKSPARRQPYRAKKKTSKKILP